MKKGEEIVFFIENLRNEFHLLVRFISVSYKKEHMECSLWLAPQTCEIEAAPERATQTDNH